MALGGTGVCGYSLRTANSCTSRAQLSFPKVERNLALNCPFSMLPMTTSNGVLGRMAYGVWRVAYGVWRMAYGLWPVWGWPMGQLSYFPYGLRIAAVLVMEGGAHWVRIAAVLIMKGGAHSVRIAPRSL